MSKVVLVVLNAYEMSKCLPIDEKWTIFWIWHLTCADKSFEKYQRVRLRNSGKVWKTEKLVIVRIDIYVYLKKRNINSVQYFM